MDQGSRRVDGGFYTEEFQKVKYPDIFLVEKVLKHRGNKVYFKWAGFNASHNSWIHKDKVT